MTTMIMKLNLNLKKISKYITVLTVVLFSYGCVSYGPSKEYNPNLNLADSNTNTVISKLIENNFYISKNNTKKQYVQFKHNSLKYLDIYVYYSDNNLNSPIKAIFIVTDLNYNGNNQNQDNAPLSEAVLKILKVSLSNLGCQTNIDFLNSGFVCSNIYNVTYTIHTDGFNKMRNFFNKPSRKELLIAIKPR